MAACSDTEKPSFSKETLPLKIRVENAVNHEMRKNCSVELSNISKKNETFPETAEKPNPKDVSSLSEDEFHKLMIEASTFNKSSDQESDFLKKLRQDNPVTDTEPSDCRKEQSSEKGTSTNSPIEIEEIKSNKASCKDDRSLASTNLEKSENRLAKSNSTFYVDKNDVDTTVTFPLKIVPSNEDQNCDETESELKRFPLHWPSPIKMQSLFNTLPKDSDTSYISRIEKQFLNADNPFTWFPQLASAMQQ